MVKVFYILQRRADLDSAAFLAYWRNVHGPLAARTPGLLKLIQSYPYPEPYGAALPADGIEEMQFASIESMQAALASPEGRAMLADVANFLDTTRSGPIVIEEDYQLV